MHRRRVGGPTVPKRAVGFHQPCGLSPPPVVLAGSCRARRVLNVAGMTTTVEPAVRPAGVTAFIRRRPLTAFFLWFFTVGQVFAFAPVIAM